MSERRDRRLLAESTEATTENRDTLGNPLPKIPAPKEERKSLNRRTLERILTRGRASQATISSLIRFRRLNLPRVVPTALREPVKQFRGQGVAIQAIGLAAWAGLGWWLEFKGVAVGAAVAIACYGVGRAKSKPWRCGNCQTPLATAKVRVCPGCHARLVDHEIEKTVPWGS